MDEQMAHQEAGGWPLGLQPLNVRVGVIRSLDLSGPLSFSTLITASSGSSSATSSDFDTESIGSSLHDKGVTLGSLIGVTGILEISSRSLWRRRKLNTLKDKKRRKTKPWFSLCTKPQLEDDDDKRAANGPSLGHFLDAERRASNAQMTNRVPIAYEVGGGSPEGRSGSKPNSLLVSNGLIVPPSDGGDEPQILVGGTDESSTLGNANGYGFPLLFQCIGGQCNH